jgi:hypothetical protein
MSENTAAIRYRVDVHGIGDNVWSNNALTFDSEQAATDYGNNLYSRWMGMDAFRVVPDSTPKCETY